MAIPLDKQFISVKDPKTGKEENIPALDPRFKQEVKFVVYQPPPLNINDGAAYEAWLERLSFIEEDMHWLLRQPHDKFWCQVIFDETLQRCVDSYLRHAPRYFDIVQELPQRGREKHNVLHKLMFMTFLRMATHKESKDTFFTPSVYGEILYENFIFDIPKLMDLCVLYGQANGPLLTKMITNVFAQQPSYNHDLSAIVPTVFQVFSNILSRCGLSSGSNPSSPQKLDAPMVGGRALPQMTTGDLQDIIFYVCDTTQTLLAFLEIYPEVGKTFFLEGFHTRVAVVYEVLMPELSSTLKEKVIENISLKNKLKIRVSRSKKNLVKIFRNIVLHNCLQPVLELSDSEDVGLHVEEYLNAMSSALAERRFLADYQGLFPFQDDLDILCQAAYTIDETRLKFIEEALHEAHATFGKKQKLASASGASGGVVAPVEPTSQGGLFLAAEATPDLDTQVDTADSMGAGASAVAGASAPVKTGVELDSLITSVKDLLPDLGEGFIELCLEEFAYDMEKVINAVLEDRLPPSLQAKDRTLARKPVEAPKSLLEQRHNIYDGDEFDFVRRDNIDMSKVYMGKKNTLANAEQERKETLAKFKPMLDKYGSMEVSHSMYDNYDEYDDEYDDTYDTNLVADDADSADELTARRPFTVPRVLGKQVEEDEEDESEEEDDKEKSPKPRDQFVANPAELREKREWQRRRNEAKGKGPAPKNYDVQGKPKGQGQETKTVRNRAFKDKNKSSMANHNRKAGADWKRSKAM